jgi:hypothetical protein
MQTSSINVKSNVEDFTRAVSIVTMKIPRYITLPYMANREEYGVRCTVCVVRCRDI